MNGTHAQLNDKQKLEGLKEYKELATDSMQSQLGPKFSHNLIIGVTGEILLLDERLLVRNFGRDFICLSQRGDDDRSRSNYSTQF